MEGEGPDLALWHVVPPPGTDHQAGVAHVGLTAIPGEPWVAGQLLLLLVILVMLVIVFVVVVVVVTRAGDDGGLLLLPPPPPPTLPFPPHPRNCTWVVILRHDNGSMCGYMIKKKK